MIVLEYLPLIILIVGGGGVLGMAIYQFLHTPHSQRYKLASLGREAQKLAMDLESGAVIEIAPQRYKAFIRTLPWVILILPFLLITAYSKLSPDTNCEALLGINLLYLNILLITYGLPILVFLLTISFLPVGIKILRNGYFPPLDAIVFTRYYARKGWQSTLRGVGMLLMPLFALGMIYYGHDFYHDLMKGESYQDFTHRMQIKCAQSSAISHPHSELQNEPRFS